MKTPQSLKLSLRELFLLILVAGIGLGWYLDHRRGNDVRAFLTGLDNMASYDPPHAFFAFMVRRGHEYRISCDPVTVLKSNYDAEDSSESTEYPHVE